MRSAVWLLVLCILLWGIASSDGFRLSHRAKRNQSDHAADAEDEIDDIVLESDVSSEEEDDDDFSLVFLQQAPDDNPKDADAEDDDESNNPTLYHKVVCENREEVLRCPNRSPVSVVKAVYGRSDSNACGHSPHTHCRLDWTNQIHADCNGQPSCILHPTNRHGDPCVGVYKYINVTYTCDAPNTLPLPPFPPAPKPILHSKKVCEGTAETISCGDGRPITVHAAVYGRTSRHACHFHPTTNCKMDWKDYIHGLCSGKTTCVVPADNRFGDPCGGVPKYLQVFYSCGAPPKPERPASHFRTVCEGRDTHLDCGSKKIHIKSAIYGRNHPHVCGSHSNTNCRLDWAWYVRNQCENRNRCSIGADNRLGDPCGGVPKFLQISYTCAAK